MKPFDLRPDPRVLVALTHTAMKPVDALCELVDNAIDSLASNGGGRIDIDLPTLGELEQGSGAIRVTDNGPGMIPDDAEKALTAGYSGKNAYDRLGMFGMGLNIATGKFSRTTRLITATRDSKTAVVVDVNLDELVNQRHYEVQPAEEPKEKYFRRQEGGTIIELSDWWKQGSVNKDFPKKLVQLGPGRIRTALGRRYATLLRADENMPPIEIMVKGSPCDSFEHCVWGEKRFVVRGSSHYPARQIFNTVLNTQNRCINCDQQVEGDVCPVDASHEIRPIEERVRGWIGVQRFDHLQDYGIDLIRNGRAIRVFEKPAFFTFTDETGQETLDYPIDGTFGRIVGEVHLDHVRVDFAKQDFNRTTPEWQRAVEFLRGKSSLKAKSPGAQDNHSPVMEIFRGYRRVRDVGFGDMYMGERQPGDDKPRRISRDVERDYYQKFLNKEEGYYDDAKWWERVEEASQIADESSEECPHCSFQNPTSTEICGGCQELLKSKVCVNADCGAKLPQSASACEYCGHPQVPEGPWKCGVCGHKNSTESDECRRCHKPKGSVNALAKETLLANSAVDDDLSVRNLEILLPDGTKSDVFNLETRIATLRSDGLSLPVVVFTDMTKRKLEVFLDKSHPVFASLQLRPEHAVASEAAALIRAMSSSLMSGAYENQHNLVSLLGKILDRYWRAQLLDSPEQIRQSILQLLEDVCAKMSDTMQDIAEDIFTNMPPDEKSEMVRSMQEAGIDISQMAELKKSGRFLLHIPPKTVVSVFREHPGRFFDKHVWSRPWASIRDLPEENVREVQEQTKKDYLNYLEDSIGFLNHRSPPLDVSRRAKLSLQILLREIAA